MVHNRSFVASRQCVGFFETVTFLCKKNIFYKKTRRCGVAGLKKPRRLRG